MSIQVAVAANVRRLRERRRLTQDGLASKIGVSQQAIAKLEMPGNPKLVTLTRVAAGLGVDVVELLR